MSVMSCYDGFMWVCMKVQARFSNGSHDEKRQVNSMVESEGQGTTFSGREREMPDVQL